jgi:hypothetical protein
VASLEVRQVGDAGGGERIGGVVIMRLHKKAQVAGEGHGAGFVGRDGEQRARLARQRGEARGQERREGAAAAVHAHDAGAAGEQALEGGHAFFGADAGERRGRRVFHSGG